MVLPVAVRYVLGHDAMRKMGASNVLIAGMKGLGVEVGMCIMCDCVYSLVTYTSLFKYLLLSLSLS